VFPIKVNQQRLVVEEVFRYGKEFASGSKSDPSPSCWQSGDDRGGAGAPIICNGFKDSSYIEAVVLATKLGRTIMPVIENFSELELLLRHGRSLRRQAQTRRAGQLATRLGRCAIGGDRSKFGLFHHRDPRAAHRTQGARHAGLLKLVHCHPGDQLQDIPSRKAAINELAHV